MAISSPFWFSPSPVPVTLDREVPCDMGMNTFESGYSYPINYIPPMDNTYSIPTYPPRYVDTIGAPIAPELEQRSSVEGSQRDFSSERGEAIEAELAQTKRRGPQRKTREKKSIANGVRTRETSHDSTDSVSEKTPAQKMRRLVQNRVSQRNFRKRQANERLRLEEQVKMLSSELHNLSDAYQDLLGRYEQSQREHSETSGDVLNTWMDGSPALSHFNIQGGLE